MLTLTLPYPSRRGWWCACSAGGVSASSSASTRVRVWGCDPNAKLITPGAAARLQRGRRERLQLGEHRLDRPGGLEAAQAQVAGVPRGRHVGVAELAHQHLAHARKALGVDLRAQRNLAEMGSVSAMWNGLFGGRMAEVDGRCAHVRGRAPHAPPDRLSHRH